MSLSGLLSDHCIIQNRTVDTSGKVDNETWTAQGTPSPCRVMTSVNRRRTSPDSAEKMQYGTLVFLTVALPKTANISIHDRIVYPVASGKVYDVMSVVQARGARSVSHIVASCDARA